MSTKICASVMSSGNLGVVQLENVQLMGTRKPWTPPYPGITWSTWRWCLRHHPHQYRPRELRNLVLRSWPRSLLGSLWSWAPSPFSFEISWGPDKIIQSQSTNDDYAGAIKCWADVSLLMASQGKFLSWWREHTSCSEQRKGTEHERRFWTGSKWMPTCFLWLPCASQKDSRAADLKAAPKTIKSSLRHFKAPLPIDLKQCKVGPQPNEWDQVVTTWKTLTVSALHRRWEEGPQLKPQWPQDKAAVNSAQSSPQVWLVPQHHHPWWCKNRVRPSSAWSLRQPDNDGTSRWTLGRKTCIEHEHEKAARLTPAIPLLRMCPCWPVPRRTNMTLGRGKLRLWQIRNSLQQPSVLTCGNKPRGLRKKQTAEQAG